MFKDLKQYIVFFAFVLIISIISFSGSYNSETINNSVFPNPSLVDTIILPANPGPSNNGGSSGWAMFFNLIGIHNVTVTQMSTGNTANASASFSVEVFTRSGNALGGPAGSGPGSSTAGWTSLGIVPVIQGTTSLGVSLIFALPPITVLAGDTIGVALKFIGAGPRYVGSGTSAYSTYSDTNLTLITGDGRSAPFTPTGSFFASRALTGVIGYVIDPITVIGNVGKEIPDGFKLAQNYPNPFNPTTNINYSIPINSFTTLIVYDYLGRELITLFSGFRSAGNYEVTFNGSALSSGVYYYKLSTEKFSDTKKMILSK